MDLFGQRSWRKNGKDISSERQDGTLDEGYVSPLYLLRSSLSDNTWYLSLEAGFVDIVEKPYKVPIGPWPKDKLEKMIGTYNMVNLLDAAEGFTLVLFIRILGVRISLMIII